MDRKTLVVAMLIAAISLIIFNLGMKRNKYQESREISGYEYARLHTVASLYSDVAETASDDTKDERVTIAEYNKIMNKFEKVRYQKEQQEAGLHESSRMPRGLRRAVH